MAWVVNTVVLAGLGVCGVVLARRIPQSSGEPLAGSPLGRYLAVTINRRQDEVAPRSRRPVPVAQLSDAVEVELRARARRQGHGAGRPAAPLRGLRTGQGDLSDQGRDAALSGMSDRHSPRRLESCSARTRASRTSTGSHTSCPVRTAKGVPLKAQTSVGNIMTWIVGKGFPVADLYADCRGTSFLREAPAAA